MAYRNKNIQTRTNLDQKWYWEVRPLGNPAPTKCHNVANFYYETIVFRNGGLVKEVETVWKDKDAFLAVLPPDVFEQPYFQEWHDKHRMTFRVEEDENFNHDESRIGDNRIIEM